MHEARCTEVEEDNKCKLILEFIPPVNNTEDRVKSN
jgi:hypothetical protein